MTKIKAQLWDKVQYGFKKYYDGMMRSAFVLDGVPNENALKQSAAYLADKVDILRCSFKKRFFRPFWKLNESATGDSAVITVKDAEPVKKALELISEQVPESSALRFRVFCVHNGEYGVIAFLVSHMCFDGADFLYFIEKFAECYNAVISGGSVTSVHVKDGDRGFGQVYGSMSPDVARKAKKLYKNVSKNRNKRSFPFDGKKGTDKVWFTVKNLSAEKTESIREKAKKAGASLNDALLAAYFRALYGTPRFDNKCRPVTIVSMMNLRRHIDGRQTAGLTNMTGFMPCVNEKRDEKAIDTVKKVAETTLKFKSDSYAGLYGIPLLDFAFKTLPFGVALAALKAGYSNPLLGMSNIGLLDIGKIKFGSLVAKDGFITGAVKYKPYFQVSFNTFGKEGRLCVAQRCTAKEKRIISAFLERMTDELERL